MICPNCNKETDGNLNFCSNCGAKIIKFKKPSEINENYEEATDSNEALEVKLNNLLETNQSAVNYQNNNSVNNASTVLNNNMNSQPVNTFNPNLNIYNQQPQTETYNTELNNTAFVNSQDNVHDDSVESKIVYHKSKKVFKWLLVIGVILLVCAIALMGFEYFKLKETDYENNIDIVTDDEIYNGITMGKYYEVSDDKTLDYVSVLEFSKDSTFKFDMNLCDGLTEMTGTYEFNDSRLILTLDDVDSEGNPINTQLSFVVIDENRMWLETEFGCITTGMNSGTFVYRKAR